MWNFWYFWKVLRTCIEAVYALKTVKLCIKKILILQTTWGNLLKCNIILKIGIWFWCYASFIHRTVSISFCMCMIFLAVKIFISLFIKMKYVHFWNYMFKLTISIDGLYIHYAYNNMPEDMYRLLRNNCY